MSVVLEHSDMQAAQQIYVVQEVHTLWYDWAVLFIYQLVYIMEKDT